MMINAVHVLVLFSVAFLICKRESPLFRKIFWPAFILKLLAGIVLGMIYKYHYQVGDTLGFFADGVELANMARTNPGQYLGFIWDSSAYGPLTAISPEPRTMFMSKIVSVFCLITQDNYWVASLYFSAISFFSAWHLFKVVQAYHNSLLLPAALAFLFLPTGILWTSGIIKESLTMAAVYFLAACFVKVWSGNVLSFAAWLLLFLGVWIAWHLKYYYVIAFLPVSTAALIVKKIILPRLTFKHVFGEWSIWLALFSILIFVAPLIHPNFYPERFLEVITSNYEAFIKLSDPEDMIHYPDLQQSTWSVFKYVPWAVCSALFRPFIWEAGNVLQFFTALENLGMLLLFLYALRSWKKVFNSPDRLLIFSMGVYIVVLSAFLALSTPNFGTLVRYRVGFISFFVLLIATGNPLLNRLQHWLTPSAD